MRKSRKTWRKELTNSAIGQFLLSRLAWLFICFVYYTSRIERIHTPTVQPYTNGEQPGIFCFWHGRLIMQSFMRPPGRIMRVLISQHNDGALITAIIRCFGIEAVRGSSKRGAREAMRTMLAIASRGENLSITPDGPRGPFQVAAPGAAFAAMKTGYPMIPMTFSARRHWRFKSWDKFMLPKPFTTIRYMAVDPIFVPADADAEGLAAATRQLADAITSITADADIACGVAP